MTFLIDKFFIEEFNKKFGLNLTYSEFKQFYTDTRDKKNNLGLVDKSYLRRIGAINDNLNK